MFLVKTIKLAPKMSGPLVQYADEWRTKIRSLNLGWGFRWTRTGSWLSRC